jgi:hypothetical protein
MIEQLKWWLPLINLQVRKDQWMLLRPDRNKMGLVYYTEAWAQINLLLQLKFSNNRSNLVWLILFQESQRHLSKQEVLRRLEKQELLEKQVTSLFQHPNNKLKMVQTKVILNMKLRKMTMVMADLVLMYQERLLVSFTWTQP